MKIKEMTFEFTALLVTKLHIRAKSKSTVVEACVPRLLWDGEIMLLADRLGSPACERFRQYVTENRLTIPRPIVISSMYYIFP